jgi:hypothetical protein
MKAESMANLYTISIMGRKYKFTLEKGADGKPAMRRFNERRRQKT